MKVLLAVLVGAVGCGSSPPAQTPPSTPPPDAPASSLTAVPTSAGLNDEGLEAMYAGNYALASEKFRNAAALVPEPKYFFNLCTSLFQEGKFSEAKTACGAVDTNQATPALVEKAHKLSAKIDDEAHRQGINVAPDSTPVRTSGGQAEIASKQNDEGVELMYVKKYAEASAKFRDAVARVPEPKYFFNLCTSLFQEGKFSEGLAACDGVAKNNPTPALQDKTNKMIERIKAEAKAQRISL